MKKLKQHSLKTSQLKSKYSRAICKGYIHKMKLMVSPETRGNVAGLLSNVNAEADLNAVGRAWQPGARGMK